MPHCGHDAPKPSLPGVADDGARRPRSERDLRRRAAVRPGRRGELAAVEKFDDRFLDRELSWLHFNQRVLELAEDPTLPLLERARFLAIFASNLDEFFMVRVAGLKRRIAAGVAVRAASGLLPREVLEQIWAVTARPDCSGTPTLFRDEIVPGAGRARASSWCAGTTWTATSRSAASGSSRSGSSRC